MKIFSYGVNYLGEIARSRVQLHNMYTFELYDTYMPEFLERSSFHFQIVLCDDEPSCDVSVCIKKINKIFLDSAIWG